jgi:broad-specificity NMP kinase
MMRILITGMSGVGKTAVIRALRELHFCAIDMDEPGWSAFDEVGHQRWDAVRLQQMMDDELSHPLFVSGCSADQVAFYPQFSNIVLLSAPKPVIAQRLACRTGNAYGKHPAELKEVMRNVDAIEPLLREQATHEIVTTQPIHAVVKKLLEISLPNKALQPTRRSTRLSADVSCLKKETS